MTPMDFRAVIENSGYTLTSEAIAAYAREHSCQIHKNHAEFLLSFNGGRFKSYVRLPITRGILELDEICRLEEGHPQDIAEVIDLISDRLARNYIPAIATACGDYLVIDSTTGKVYLWEHEGGDPELLGNDLPSVLRQFTYEDPTTDLERACGSYSLEQIRSTPLYASDYANICQEAAKQGNLPLVIECVHAGLPPGKALRCAAMNGHREIIEFLLLQGHDLNAMDENGMTILDWVAWKPQYHAIIEQLGGVSGTQTS